MFKHFSALTALACLSSSALAQATDSCASAPPVGTGIFTYDLNGATNDFPGTCGDSAAAEDAWVLFSSPVAGTVTARTCGQTGADTVLEVVSACGGTSIACNDDSCGFQSRVAAPVGSGQAVLIRVASFGGGAHIGAIEITFEAFTASDDCASAAAVGAGGIYPYDLAGFTNDFAGTCGFTETAQDAWYSFTAPRSGLLSVETCGQTTRDTVLELVSACGGASLACNDDFCNFQSRTNAVLVGGQNVRIRVADYSGGVHAGNIAVNFTPGAGAPANDNCASATVVGTGTFPYDLVGASNDFAGPCGDTGTAEDVWFSFTAPNAGLFTVSTCDLATNDTVITLVDGCGGSALICVDDSCAAQTTVQYDVTAGQLLLIRMAQFGGGQHVGQIVITLDGVGCPPDFNGDGTLDPDDLADYISAFFSQPPGAGSDFNGDGNTDPDDLADYISAYFTGC